MELSEQKKRSYASVSSSRPNAWEVDEIFELLTELDETTMEALLSHVGAIWPVSHSLCFACLTNGVKALGFFPIELLGEWVRQILGLYERKGLLGARKFMADVDRFFLGPMRGEAGVAFEEISVTMVHYMQGISSVLSILMLPNCHPLIPKQYFCRGLLILFREKKIISSSTSSSSACNGGILNPESFLRWSGRRIFDWSCSPDIQTGNCQQIFFRCSSS